VGDEVNVEFDLLAKYIERYLETQRGGSGVDMGLLRRTGFVE
jgi:riboflavin synthase alpha subunit